MTTDPAGPQTPYIQWAKAELGRPLANNLGLSGVPRPSDPMLGSGSHDLGAAARAWCAAVGSHLDLPAERVHPALGTSGANHLVYAAFAAGGTVAVEAPAYDPLLALSGVIGARVRRFGRPLRGGARIVRSELEAVAEDCDLLVLTDLHNPGGWRLADDDLDLALSLAEAHDFHILIDEVYLDFDPLGRPSAVHRDDRIVITGSLTKAHGLGDLRAGWIAGSEESIRRVRATDDLICPGHPALHLEAAAAWMPQARARIVETRERALARTEQVDAWVQSTQGIAWVPPHGGITGWFDLAAVDAEALCAHLLEQHDLVVVPGRFFEEPQSIRISYDLPEDDLARALDRIAEALKTLR